MSADLLFPPTPLERLSAVAKFVAEERLYGVIMLGKYADDAGRLRYWGKRVTQCDEAIAHLAALTEKVGP